MRPGAAIDGCYRNHGVSNLSPLSLQRHCVQCGRDFVTEVASGSCYAVFVSATSFYRLADEVTERWLRESCLGKRPPSDDEDRNKKIAQFRVSTAQISAS
jgi:hypothetical protein